MYTKKIITFCQVLKKMHIKNWFLFPPHSVQWVNQWKSGTMRACYLSGKAFKWSADVVADAVFGWLEPSEDVLQRRGHEEILLLQAQLPTFKELSHTQASSKPWTDWLSCGFTSHSTQDRSFPRHFIKPIFWLGVKKTKPNTTKAAFANQKKCTTTQHTHTHIHI